MQTGKHRGLPLPQIPHSCPVAECFGYTGAMLCFSNCEARIVLKPSAVVLVLSLLCSPLLWAQSDAQIQHSAARIKQHIEQVWRQTAEAQGSGRCRLLIYSADNGSIRNVQVMQSSGNAAFDRAAVDAIYRSAPLPLPNNPTERAVFSEIEFVFAGLR